MLEDLDMSASYLGILFAILGIVAALSTKKQEEFHNKFRNKSLITIGFLAAGSCVFAGIAGIMAKQHKIGVLVIIVFYIAKYFCAGIYYPLIEKYLSNFTNQEIDTKIFTANNFLKSIASTVVGVLAAFLLDRMETAYCMIIIGCIFFLFIISKE